MITRQNGDSDYSELIFTLSFVLNMRDIHRFCVSPPEGSKKRALQMLSAVEHRLGWMKSRNFRPHLVLLERRAKLLRQLAMKDV